MTTKTTDNTFKATISNSCQCRYCPQCEMGIWSEDGEECHYCSALLEYVGCDGCWDEMTEDVKTHLFDPWRASRDTHELGDDFPFYIQGRGMTWQSINANSAQLQSWSDALNCLSLNGDYTLRFTFDPDAKTLTVRRSSHDEPMGAWFEFYAWDIDAITESTDERLHPIIDLWRWSSNFGAGSAANPLSMFMDLIGFSQDYYGGNFHPWDNLDGCGYVEADYLADALKVWSTMPQDVTELLENLCNYANN